MAVYTWPKMSERTLIGKPISRLDGPQKSGGRAKYSSDVNPPELLYGAILTSPYAHAKVKSIDLSPARSSAGVTAVVAVAEPGAEIQWEGSIIAAVAAETEVQARDAARKIKVEWEVLPHLVKDDSVAQAGVHAKPAGEQIQGDPDEAKSSAAHTASGFYGLPVLTHCCLEPHGQVVQWKGNEILVWPSTQSVSNYAGDLGAQLSVPATAIKVQMDHIGGGFGSKFQSDQWGAFAAQLSKESGGRPVKFFLDRNLELMIAGNRPSHYAKVTVAADANGKITLWESESWSSGGIGGGNIPPIPYVFTRIPNQRKNHHAISTNNGPQRAWRAPNHAQASYLTCCAIDDLAARMDKDPLEVFLVNVENTTRAEAYRRQLQKGARLIDWSSKWKGRGKSRQGHIARGLGIGINTWGGAGHESTATARIHPDGTVEVECGTQDLGVGTRTVMTQVAAETLGLTMDGIRLKIGSNAYPPSGASGGSTTVGAVTSATRIACTDALNLLFEKVSPSLDNAPVDTLEAKGGRIYVKGNPSKGMSWVEACKKLGVSPVEAQGRNNPRNPRGLNTGGVAGIQMAEVVVDMETGVITLEKMVAVQDFGLVVNPKTAASQIYGAMIMNICGALYEERIVDQATGRMLNADMEFYKLAGAPDIGQLIVEMEIDEENDSRGVIGLGEPPAVGGIAAIGNAVANAIGVRVPVVPLSPRRVLDAMDGRSL
jgi:xanthine dehydrogenase YagR molybdenum-binding subunit